MGPGGRGLTRTHPSSCTEGATIVAPETVSFYGPPPMNRLNGLRASLRRATTWAPLVVVACSMAAACSSPSSATATKSTIRNRPNQGAVNSTTTAPGHPVDASMSGQIVAAWLASQRAFETAALTADPSEPALAATTIDPQLSSTRALLDKMHAAGQIARGTRHYGKPTVLAFQANVAIVRSCDYDTEVAVWAASGQPVPGVPGQVDFVWVTSTMELTGTGWKLFTQTVGTGQCHGS